MPRLLAANEMINEKSNMTHSHATNPFLGKKDDDRPTLVSRQELDSLYWSEEPQHLLFEKVERAKQEWEATADSLPELICVVNDRGRVLRTNRTIETWNLGQVTAVQGLDLHELIHPQCSYLFCYLEQFLRQAREKVSNAEHDEIETYDPILRRHLLIRVRPILELGKVEPRTAVVVMHDVTENKRTEDAVRRYTKRLESINEIQKAILAARSPEEIAQAALGRIVHLVPFRQACVALTKPESSDFYVLVADAMGETTFRPGKSFPRQHFKGSDERRSDKFFVIKDLASLANLSVMEQLLLKDGICSYISIPLTADGEFIGALGLGCSDLDAYSDEHVGIATEVADLLAIATRHARLAAKLNQTNGELQEALQAKDDMIQNVSHELRTPLGIIYGYTQLLESIELGPLSDEQYRALWVMHQQEDRLRFMVDRLLTLQTFSADKLQQRQLDVNAWLEKIVGPYMTRALQVSPSILVSLEVQSDLPSFMADEGLLRQVIANLLDNAIKFSPAGGTVSLRARLLNGRMVVSVSDHGIGIPPDKLEQIFGCFYQVDASARRRFGGMGIGLALCRAVVEAHRGHIWAESQGEGRGSTFYVSLPIDHRLEGEVGAHSQEKGA